MKIYIEKENETKEIKIENPITFKVLLKKLNISLESVILMKNNEICLEDELVNNEDEITLLSVVSGG